MTDAPATRRGLAVALVGPDGAGKTTVARRLEVELPVPVVYLYMGVSAESSNRLLPTTRIVRALRRRTGAVERGPRPRSPEPAGRPRSPARSLRAAARTANRIAEESYRQLHVSWHRRRGRVVLLDRHFFADYYLHDVAARGPLPASRRVHGWFVSRILPRPDLVVHLDVPAQVLHARKGEGTLELLEDMRGGYAELAGEVPDHVTVDADRPLTEVVADVRALVLQRVAGDDHGRDEDQLEALELARQRAARWFPHLEGTGVQLRRTHRKRHSTVHELVLVHGDCEERVFVKESRSVERPDAPARPHAVPTRHLRGSARLQADALTDLGRVVRSAGDPMLGAVSVLDCVDERLLVTSAAEGDPLRSHVLGHVRWNRRGGIELDEVFSRAGRILRLFHDGVPRPRADAALEERGELVAATREFVDHLAGTTASEDRIRELGRRVVTQIERHLPARLAVATRFGDFGLTNLLVTAEGRVTAIDTLAALRTPPLHDATYLISGLTAIRPQVITGGRSIPSASIERWTDAFWDGYLGGRRRPRGAIAVWSSLRLLERWTAKATRTAGPVARRGAGSLIDSYLAKLVDHELSEAEATPPAPELLRADDHRKPSPGR